MTFGKPEVKKEAVAGGVTTLSELLRQRLEIGDMLDQVIDELGVQYGLLTKVQSAISKELHNMNVHPGNAPAWLAESRTAEALRNRLAMELAEHSSGGGRESVLGPVLPGGVLAELFAKDHAGVVAGRE